MKPHRNPRRRTRGRLKIESLEPRAMMHAEGMLSGFVYLDTDNDGVRDDSESGLPGIVIRLTGSDHNGHSVELSTFTNSQGRYTFDELEPGLYELAQRQSRALIDGLDSTPVPGVTPSDDLFAGITLGDEQDFGENNFGERAVRPEFFNALWFFASSPPQEQMLLESIAISEELDGNTDLAESIRAGGDVIPVDDNLSPVAKNDAFPVDQDDVLNVPAASGVLANDTDPEDDALTAVVVTQPTSGSLTFNSDGSFTYAPDTGFSGTDSFTYRASDGKAESSAATVTLTINSTDTNTSPVAANDPFSMEQDQVLTIAAGSGVLANDVDADNDPLTAAIVSQPSRGSVTLNADGSFMYTPQSSFFGSDSFTYRASDGSSTSNVATVTITVNPVANELFGDVAVGAFTDSGLLGTRTDLVAGAPPITANHINGDLDYTGYSNPPTYGNHHGFDPDGTDSNPGITPRPTGVYTTEQPDEDLIHNLEHGHVWISYDPSLISANDRAALERLVRDGSSDANGGGVGVILTPRAANNTMIALASWARLLTLDSYDPATIRNFIETNRGKAPEGFITP